LRGSHEIIMFIIIINLFRVEDLPAAKVRPPSVPMPGVGSGFRIKGSGFRI